MALTETELSAMVDEAWRVIHDVVYTGQALLQNGKTLTPSDREYLLLLQHLAKMKAPRVKKTPLVEDFVSPLTLTLAHGSGKPR